MSKGLAKLGVVALFAVLVAGLGEAAANQAEDTFAGRVLILTKRPPNWFKSQSAFVQFLRANSTKVVYENKDKQWSFETISFFKKPLGDFEVEMVFYDVTGGKSQKRFVNSFTQYTQDRNTRSLSQNVSLIRPDFDANRSYLVLVQSHGQIVAQGDFQTRGTTQAAIEQQAQMERIQKEMEESMRDLERKAKEQEEREKNASKNAADSLF